MPLIKFSSRFSSNKLFLMGIKLNSVREDRAALRETVEKYISVKQRTSATRSLMTHLQRNIKG